MTDPLNLVMIIIGFLLIIASLALPKMLRKKGEQAAATYQPTDEMRALERIEQGMLKLEDTSRELFGRLDTRARALIRLVEEAEVRAQHIETLVARAKKD